MEIAFTNKVVGGINVVVALTEEQVSDIMVGAIEGGINHWGYIMPGSKKGKPSDEPTSTWCARKLLDGDTIHLGDIEDDEELFQLDLSKLLTGCQSFATKFGHFDVDQMDVESYDYIIQSGIFGELRYA